jgi:hypothetical protein
MHAQAPAEYGLLPLPCQTGSMPMAGCVIQGAFGSVAAAQDARQLLIDAGVPAAAITISIVETADGIAAEAIGQSYENQPGEDDSERARDTARQNEAVRSAVCALSVDADTEQCASLAEAVMRRAGARRVGRNAG